MFTIQQQEHENGPWPIFERLLQTHDELADLDAMLGQGVTIAFLLREGEWTRGDRGVLGMCYCQPSAQGSLRPLFEQLLEDTIGYYPDFLVILNGEFWDTASAVEREVLVFHEVLHAGWARDQNGVPKVNRKTGQPVPCIRNHDLEEFNAVVRRYGAWKGDVTAFLEAAREGGA